MSYQNVGKPRIYLNLAEYLAVSKNVSIHPVFRTLPVKVVELDPGNVPNINFGVDLSFNQYIAFLGYDGNAAVFHDTSQIDVTNPIVGDINTPGYTIIDINQRPTDIASSTPFNGEYTGHIGVGTVAMGIYYNFPTSPDLNLSLSYEYESVKEITTLGGHTLTNNTYIRPPKWGNIGSWEFLGGDPDIARSGRRIWEISFSYMSDDKIFPSNLGLVNNDGWNGSEYASETNSTDGTLLDSSYVGSADTLQRAIHLTYGGRLPFIFQPDSNNNQVFAIAKFDQKSFKFEQVAYNVYNVKLKIREVW